MGIYLGPVRLTKRGVRVPIGPRIARLHIGAGGTGVSTGAGPFSLTNRFQGGADREEEEDDEGEYGRLAQAVAGRG